MWRRSIGLRAGIERTTLGLSFQVRYQSQLRNIGIAAHIDSGKTTLTERVLYYTGRIHSIHEVRGRDAVGAKMDSMDLEREKGITIQSAATFCEWKGNAINIIDTPGHVDFTIEVERALRVLDGAVLVLCAVSGVQSQTTTVDRQMKRYDIPRVAFINKMDRAGANPEKVLFGLRQKLKLHAALVQIPIGAEDAFEGVVDVIRRVAIYNQGEKGEQVKEGPVPDHLVGAMALKRKELIEYVAEVDETLSDLFLDEQAISEQDIIDAIRRSTIAGSFVPVFVGSAYKNTGVQNLLDGVMHYLPQPSEVKSVAFTVPEAEEVKLTPALDAPVVALAFKLEEGKFGQLTYVRIYQGTLKRSAMVTNSRTGKRVKVPRIVKMHSDEMEDVQELKAGEIGAIFGLDCASGDTFCDSHHLYSMTSMFVPEPVISLAIKPIGKETPAFSRALQRFQREDPTFKVKVDAESGETIISGMGELHLEIYVERMKREYAVACETGKPKVAFRETITEPVKFNYLHKKQTGGAGQYGKIEGFFEPIPEGEEGYLDIHFENRVIGGNIPSSYIPAIEKGFRDAMERGSVTGNNVKGVRIVLEDGAYHAVDSSELAFRLCAAGCFREFYPKAAPVVLEPIMDVDIVAPTEFQAPVLAGVNQRHGNIIDTDVRDDDFTIKAEVSLNDMFGYLSQLRAMTQGKGEFQMEYKTHQPVLPHIQADMAETYRKLIGRKT